MSPLLKNRWKLLFLVAAVFISIIFFHMFMTMNNHDYYYQVPTNKQQETNPILPPPIQHQNGDSRNVLKSLHHLHILDRDTVVRWIPRSNGAVLTNHKFHPRTFPQQHERQINSENDPHHIVQRSGKNVEEEEKSRECFWKVPFVSRLNSVNDNQNNYRQVQLNFCSGHNDATKALVREIESVGVVEALQRDLDYERHHIHQKHNSNDQHDNINDNLSPENIKRKQNEKLKQQHEMMTTTQDQLLLACTVFGTENVKFNFLYGGVDFTIDRQDQVCDFIIETNNNSILGGGVIHEKATEQQGTSSFDSLLEDESYSLIIPDLHPTSSKQIVKIETASVQGFHHAMVSLFLHSKENGEVFTLREKRKIRSNKNNDDYESDVASVFAIPCLHIVEDKPALGWRAQHVDIARHFFTTTEILENVVRPMSWSKMNILHLHLSDDQGWRVESAVFPSLHLLGGRRERNLNGRSASKKFVNSLAYNNNNTNINGGNSNKNELSSKYWNIEEIWSFVIECRARGIRVMPEIDLPSHATALLLGLEAEMLRFFSSSPSSKQNQENNNYVTKILTERLTKRLNIRDSAIKILSSSDIIIPAKNEDNKDKNNSNADHKNSHLLSRIYLEAIPEAAKAIRHTLAVFEDEKNHSAITFGFSRNNKNGNNNKQIWRRSFFGTFYHANGDCEIPLHLEQENSLSTYRELILKNIKQQQENENKNNDDEHHHHHHSAVDSFIHEFLSLHQNHQDDDIAQFEKFFLNSAFNFHSKNKDESEVEKLSLIRQFIQGHSALNCMGGTHAVVDPSIDAASILSLVLNEVNYHFQAPLHGLPNDKNKNRKNNNNNNKQKNMHLVPPSSTFGPSTLFHVGGDQAEFLRDFSWAPWEYSAQELSSLARDDQNENDPQRKAIHRGEAIVVNGDEENDAEARKKSKNNKQNGISDKANGNDQRKAADRQLLVQHHKKLTLNFPSIAFVKENKKKISSPSTVPTTSYLQGILTSYLIDKITEFSGTGTVFETRCAVWDETLIELASKTTLPVLPPLGTIIIFWRDDGVPWRLISNIIMAASQNERTTYNNRPAAAAADSLTMMMIKKESVEKYYPLVFAGKTRLYFDYAQFPGKASKNKFWPLNTFGNWIPHDAATLERVFGVPDLFPPSFTSSCSSGFQEDVARDLREKTTSSALNVIKNKHLFSFFSQNELPGFKVIGIQGNLWSELLNSNPAILRYQLFPRMFAVAEIGWAFCLSGLVPSVRMNLMKIVNADEGTGDNNEGAMQRVMMSEQEMKNFIAGTTYQEQHFSCRMTAWMKNLKSEQQDGGDDENGVNINDRFPQAESRCLEFDINSKPVMTSCTTSTKKSGKNSKQNSASSSVYYTIWESKMLCSAQFEESN